MTSHEAGALEGRRIVIVCGSGGVGKTTITAALALSFARGGKRTIAMAVDPAKRLATSLHLPRNPGERATVDAGGGHVLTTLLLDTKRTFDELVERHAGSTARRDRILANRFYRRITDTLSGTHEYMAMERLYQLATTEDWEAIVIDTPPTRSALAFLDAPRRMTDFLGGRMFRWLLWPYRRAGRVGVRGAGLGARALAHTIGRIAGSELLADVAEFLAAFEGMYEGFKRRAERVLQLLGEEQTAFVVVAAPERQSLEEASHFVTRLGEAGMHLGGVVVNRWVDAPALEVPEAALERLASGTPEERAAGAVLRLVQPLQELRSREEVALEAFVRAHPAVGVVRVPEMAADLGDRESLAAVSAAILGRKTGPPGRMATLS
jgi:anion-transporting  ArsA/GET3 family ATPase